MDVDALRALLAVLDGGGFGAAAADLGISQPSVSRRVARIEAEAGCELVDRSARPPRPTPAGALVVEHYRAAVDAVDRAARRLREHHDDPPPLRVGYVPSAARGWTARLLAAAAGARVGVELRALTTGQQVPALLTGELHAGLLRPASSGQRLTGLALRLLARNPLVALVPVAHRLAGGPALTRADLAGEPLVLHPRAQAPGLRRGIDLWLGAADGRAGDVHEAWDLPTAVSLVEAGAGIALLIAPPPPRSPRCVPVALRAAPSFDLCLAGGDDPRVARLADALAPRPATGRAGQAGTGAVSGSDQPSRSRAVSQKRNS
ncbi:LysR family transcriptional regulator [Kineococcus gypseus]|uniref:LysR family transcriptional regulator n=1 Tax=Kineococcus gypseus TaxID=1637102 RepID=UPI003D7E2D2F